ncbi:MAG: hypothetical protein ACHQU1_01365 [Gemmatimonadales bacterium]
MIRLPEGLAPVERYALELLVDLARLVPVDDPGADVVRIEVTDPPGKPPALRTLSASRWLIQPGDGFVRVFRPALRAVADIASAAREQRSTERDRHGRVPPTVNVLVDAGMERHPVVSEAAVRLREAVLASAGRRAMRLAVPWPGGKRWAAAFTHDLDIVALWPAFTLRRIAELVGKGELAASASVFGSGLAALLNDPIGRGVATLLESERAAGIRSTWFILCGTPTLATMRAGDLTYSPESKAAHAILKAIAAAGHDIGLHGSFATSDGDGVFAAQRARLAGLVGRDIGGVRQHFLKMRPGATHRAMREAGFAYDTSLGFADRNGFRLGVADVVPLWDAERETTIGIDEVPLCWMDRALSKYRAVEDPHIWVRDALKMAQRSRAVNGLWVGVWHPNLVPALGFPGAPEAFTELAQSIAAGDPHFGSLGELVHWRRVRRSARVKSLAPDGRIEVVADGGAAVALEEPPPR